MKRIVYFFLLLFSCVLCGQEYQNRTLFDLNYRLPDDFDPVKNLQSMSDEQRARHRKLMMSMNEDDRQFYRKFLMRTGDLPAEDNGFFVEFGEAIALSWCKLFNERALNCNQQWKDFPGYIPHGFYIRPDEDYLPTVNRNYFRTIFIAGIIYPLILFIFVFGSKNPPEYKKKYKNNIIVSVILALVCSLIYNHYTKNLPPVENIFESFGSLGRFTGTILFSAVLTPFPLSILLSILGIYFCRRNEEKRKQECQRQEELKRKRAGAVFAEDLTKEQQIKMRDELVRLQQENEEKKRRQHQQEKFARDLQELTPEQQKQLLDLMDKLKNE